jgi:hypothetical protein
MRCRTEEADKMRLPRDVAAKTIGQAEWLARATCDRVIS